MGINQEPFLIASKEKGSEKLIFSLAVDRKGGTRVDSIFAKDIVSFTIGNALFSNAFPRPFISSVERTGRGYF